MKKIKLTQGKFAKVDDADFPELNRHHWQYATSPTNKGGYAVRFDYTGMKKGKKQQTTIYMHRHLLLGDEGNRKVVVKHQNKDGLDNRRKNLIVCDRPKSKHKGVYWINKNWGCVWSDPDDPKKKLTVTAFRTEDEAAKALDALRLVADHLPRREAAEFARAAAAA